MAIKLPKYQKQVGVASGAEVYKDVDERAALAPIQAASQAIGATTDMAVEFGSRLHKHKVEGATAEYGTAVKTELKQAVALAKEQARRDGVPEEEAFEKTVKPAIDAFYENQTQKGYPKRVTDMVARDYEFQNDKYMKEDQIEQVQNQVIRANIAKRDLAWSLEQEGNFEEADKVWDSLEDTAKPGDVDSWKSNGVYMRNVNEINSMTEPKDIQEYMNKTEMKRMTPAQYQQFRSLGESKIRRSTTEQFAPLKKDFNSLHKKGELTASAIEASALPQNEKNVYLKMLDDDIQKSYTMNELVIDDLYGEVDTFLSGKYSGGSDVEYDNLLKKIEEAELPAVVKMDIMHPIIMGQSNTETNSPFFIKKTKMKVYDEGVSRLLNKYRDAFNAANAGMTATEKMYGFGNGYRDIITYAEENKDALKSGQKLPNEDDFIRQAVAPAVSNRIKEEGRKRNIRNLQATPDDEFKEKANQFWGE